MQIHSQILELNAHLATNWAEIFHKKITIIHWELTIFRHKMNTCSMVLQDQYYGTDYAFYSTPEAL